MKSIFTVLLVFNLSLAVFAQIDPANIYSFEYDGKTYEIIKENKTWADAAAAAVERGGYLAEINNVEEQNALFDEIQNAGIDNANTVAQDGGGASYVWLGGNDIADEGRWLWDGDNDGNSTHFWLGNASGNAVNGLYNNWGNEPDDYNNNQDALGLALTQWPVATGSLGAAGQWNDVDHTNTLYFVIEHNGILPVELISFNGKQQGDIVSLSWRTASQVNSKYFVVERALDGIHFQEISRFDIDGDSDVAKSYRCFDQNPIDGVNYYRLKAVDLDLTEEYFQIINVYFHVSKRIDVYPNPVYETLTIGGDQNGDLVFVLYNYMGQRVIEKKITAHKIDLGFLENGTYFYIIKDSFGAIIIQDKIVKL